MSTHTEGRLNFDFKRALGVDKLDAPGEPKPHGMSFVDFVVEEERRCLLIEVKDPEGVSSEHRASEMKKYLKKIEGDGLIFEELVPKTRDSYTFLHLMGRDDKAFILVAVLGIGSPDMALLGDFKNRLLRRLRKETSVQWVRQYVKDCIVVTPEIWNSVFSAYPLSGI